MHYVRDASGSVLAVYEGAAVKEHALYGLGRLGVYYRAGGTYAYQLADHLGNVRAVVMKDGAGALAVTNRTDYYPFGMPMPGRNVDAIIGTSSKDRKKTPRRGWRRSS